MSTNVKNVGDNPRENQVSAAIRALAKEVGVSVTAGLETCMSCEHFVEATEICRLAQQRPPARVIAYGCPEYLPDIPF